MRDLGKSLRNIHSSNKGGKIRVPGFCFLAGIILEEYSAARLAAGAAWPEKQENAAGDRGQGQARIKARDTGGRDGGTVEKNLDHSYPLDYDGGYD